MGLLIFQEVQHLPALTYLRKTEGKLGSKETKKRKVAIQTFREYYDQPQNTLFPLSWGNSSGISRDVNISKILEKKNALLLNLWKTSYSSYNLNGISLLLLDEILPELPKFDRFWIAQTSKQTRTQTNKQSSFSKCHLRTHENPALKTKQKNSPQTQKK